MKKYASDKGRQAGEKLRGIKDETVHHSKEFIENQKHSAADLGSDVADALDNAADELADRRRAVAAEYVRSASSGVRRFSDSVHGQSIEGVFQEVKRVSRRQPLLLFGGALAAGFLVTRLLKSGSEGGGRPGTSDWDRRGDEDYILDRDQHSTVSVSSRERGGDPSYTYNADESEPYDPHLSDSNAPGAGAAPRRGTAEENILDRDQPGPVSVSARDKGGDPSYTYNAEKTEPYDPNLADQSSQGGEDGGRGSGERVLDRDQSGPVSVSAKDKGGDPSYTYNTPETEPYDPHLSDKNAPGPGPTGKAAPGEGGGEKALDRDQPGPVSVSAKDRDGDPTYTYNAEKTEPYDPNLADQSSRGGRVGDERVLDRDQPGPVSVSAKDKGGDPSYTHNTPETEPYDPHLSDKNAPGAGAAPQAAIPGKKDVQEKVLDRDQPGPVSAAQTDEGEKKGKGKKK